MKVKGVLDRIEDGGMAVILIEEKGLQFTIPEVELPKGSKVGSWFEVIIREGEVTRVVLDREQRKVKEQQVKALIEKLRKKTSR